MITMSSVESYQLSLLRYASSYFLLHQNTFMGYMAMRLFILGSCIQVVFTIKLRLSCRKVFTRKCKTLVNNYIACEQFSIRFEHISRLQSAGHKLLKYFFNFVIIHVHVMQEKEVLVLSKEYCHYINKSEQNATDLLNTTMEQLQSIETEELNEDQVEEAIKVRKCHLHRLKI